MRDRRKGYHSLRKHRFSRSNHCYHLVFNTKSTLRPFECFETARSFVRILKGHEEAGKAHTLAYCLMPDHVHWLVKLGDDELSTLVKRVKSMSTLSMGVSVWQRGYYDHLIRGEESLVNVARYIVRNPLAAGLVDSVGDYPHWDSVWL
ncbi:REP-associated tyrosine transposase [Saccharospirillum salsuginis]|uniref:REP-associated tyrosine transposase n=1 Tax=Saccharospirillum salsuginis TaxID=418750 RepID=UPI001678E140|nr:transposase [Saccharospirillum salsuginis]